MRVQSGVRVALAVVLVLAAAGCGGKDPKRVAQSQPIEPPAVQAGEVPPPPAAPLSPPPSLNPSASAAAAAGAPAAKPKPGGAAPGSRARAAGNPGGGASVPGDAKAENTSKPDRVIGNGTASSCTSAAVVSAVRAGGVITFNCGPSPVTITMDETAKVPNSRSGGRVVIDGGGKVTLSGAGKRRILLMNTCDSSLGPFTTRCDNQDSPHLAVQNIAFVDGNATGDNTNKGGGAVFVRGGRFKVVNASFAGNKCGATGQDLGGGALRVLDQFNDLPVFVVGSTFDGGSCSNGAATSSIGVSWTFVNCLMTGNKAIGRGANPARGGTPGGGSGGAIYMDGDTIKLTLAGTRMEGNRANEGGGAIFFVSNNNTGSMSINNSTLTNNPSDGFETRGLKGIFYQSEGHPASVSGSTLK